MATQVPELKKKRQRSPNYPAVGLREAIERLNRFMEVDKRAGAPAEIAAKHMGFNSAHGGAMSVLAALKRFGLVEDRDGRVVPTQRGIEINSLPATHERRAKAIRDAALAPPIYAELIEQYKTTGLPHDETLEGELRADKGFNPNGVKEFIRGFRDTLEFAGLSDFKVLGSEQQGESGKEKPKIGDWVQWEHNGMLGLPKPKKLVRVSEDGLFGFVEGSNTGLPISEIIHADAPEQLPDFSAFPGFGRKDEGKGAKMRQDVFSLAEGEAVIHWPTPLSADSIQDLEEWLDLVKRKIKRSTADTSEKTQAE